MTEYIEREKVLSKAAPLAGCFSNMISAYDVIMIPAADVVPVVRCMDCKYYKPQKKSAHWENRTNYCNRIVTVKVQPYDFCSYGERKEGDDKG